MKIAHVIRRLSFDDWGGTEQVVWNIAKAQARAGHEVRIFATNALTRTRPAVETVDGLEILRFKPVYPWWPMPSRLIDELDRKGGNPFVPGLGRALKQWRPDVIHCHAMARIAELCLRTARSIGAKAVISLHGGASAVPAEEAKSLKAPTRGRIPWGKALDIAMRWTRRVPEDFDGIVCVGEDEYQHYSKIHPHVLNLPNGVDAARFAPPPGAEIGAVLKAKGALDLLCVARIDRQKNQMMLVEALSRHPKMTVTLLGPITQPDYCDELFARARALRVDGRLCLPGSMRADSDELVAAYHRADAFVLPSRHEPFGIVVLEAWAAGLPVLASDVGGLSRLCAANKGAALMFKCDDPDTLDKAIADLPGRSAALRNAGLEAAKRYDWAALAQNLVAFIGEI